MPARRFTPIAAAARPIALSVVAGAAPANAAIREAAGSRTCLAGQHVYVGVELHGSADIVFYRGTSVVQQRIKGLSGFIEHYSGYRSTAWRVTTTGSISGVWDGCAADPARVAP